jgi:hypothetical protein
MNKIVIGFFPMHKSGDKYVLKDYNQTNYHLREQREVARRVKATLNKI